LANLKDSKGTIPVPLLHLGAILQEDEHKVTIFDFSTFKYKSGQFNENEVNKKIKEILSDTKPDLVGINCFTTLHFPFTQLLCKIIKEFNKIVPIALGGVHPSLFAKEILTHDNTIDYIIMGEGELQFAALANSYSEGSFMNLEKIPAFAFRDVKGNIVLTKRDGFINDLDTLPMPAWDLIDLTRYYSDHSRWYNPKGLQFEACIPILSSRSCPFSCNFCACYATMGRQFRKKSPKRVVDEIQMLHEKHGQNYFGFIDDNVNLDQHHIIEICNEIIRRNLNIQYETTCGVHIASLNGDVIDAMADSGCVFVRLPIEHGSDYIRDKVIGKNLSREKIYSAAENLTKRKIFTSSMFIMGFPEETAETLEDTYRLICDLKLDLNYVFNLIPFPGTRVFKQALEDNLLTDNFNILDLWKGLVNLDPVQDECRFFIKPYNMTLDELMHYRLMFDKVQFFSNEAKELNKKCNRNTMMINVRL
jgi:radical SAM superfamily enzyme YgiQ (UPF0313 family)